MTKFIQKHVFYINNKTYFVIPTSNENNFIYSSLRHQRSKCRANQWTGLYMITAPVIKALIVVESHVIWLRVIRGQNHINDEETHTQTYTYTYTHKKTGWN